MLAFQDHVLKCLLFKIKGVFRWRYLWILKMIESTSKETRSMSPRKIIKRSNRQPKKVMVSVCLTCYGATPPFFVNESHMKVNAVTYKKHLERKLIPSGKKLFSHQQCIILHDGAPSHGSNLVQESRKRDHRKRFVRKTDWPPSSLDCNPLGLLFLVCSQGRGVNRPFK